MPDYDVGAASLSSPPAVAVIQPYRPAVLVRNNGVHDALAVGSLRIYGPAGLLIFTTELYSPTIAPGDDANALAVDYWTPPAIGRYQVIAYVTCINDQYEPNNSLPPCFVQVREGEPEPPTPVLKHAAQHEEGAEDEIIVDGLHGRLTDAQTPTSHKTTHQAAGADMLDVTGLPGILSEGQPIADHKESHEDGGGDELNVEGLRGQLYNVQKPDVHNNSAHDPNYATDSDLQAHKTAATAHDNRRNVAGGFCGLDSAAEVPSGYLAPVPMNVAHHFLKVGKFWVEAQELSEKGQANGYPGLDASALVPAAQLGSGSTITRRVLYQDGTWKDENRQRAWINGTVHVFENTTEIILTLTDALPPDGTTYSLEFGAWLVSSVLANSMTIKVKAGRTGQALTEILTSVILIAPGATARHACLHAALQVLNGSLYAAGIETDDMDLVPRTTMPALDGVVIYSEGPTIQVTMSLNLPGTTTDLWCTQASLVRHGL